MKLEELEGFRFESPQKIMGGGTILISNCGGQNEDTSFDEDCDPPST